MADSITLTFDDSALVGFLDGLSGKVAEPGPMLHQIGQAMVESSQARFGSLSGPDGDAWAPNQPSTLDRWLEAKGRKSDKDGKKTGYKKGWGAGGDKREAAAGSKKPLHGISGSLEDQFHYNVSSLGVEWGNSMNYSRVQQFGAAKGTLGPNAPWGDIPARPFLGLSEGDKGEILDIIGRHLLPT